MINQYRMAEGDIEVTVQVENSKLTPEVATLINDFFSGSEERLRRADGDPVKAALLMAFPIIFKALADGYNERGATARLNESEGFPDDCGITVIDYVMPNFEYATIWEVEPS